MGEKLVKKAEFLHQLRRLVTKERFLHQWRRWPRSDGFFLEYDDERSGSFEPLRFVPKGRMVVLGLITSKKGALEKKDDIKRRIDAAAKYIDLDQLALSPQCGFASTLLGNLLTEDQQFAKLALVVEIARDVWGE
jgi:5-methyltetrahydropteroyltriglutamate--homocysteine methyltransferase